ncbi:MAG TPA: FecR domain-containing protein, partial [Chitinophagaceae bacterium]|nr:FecR domain-containing protein [Chitinophagaceae bacterium]
MDTNNRLNILFDRYTTGEATDAELTELSILLNQPRMQSVREELVAKLYDHVKDAELTTDQSERIFETVLTKINRQAEPGKLVETASRFNWRRIAIAASILLVMGLGSYFLFFKHKTDQAIPPLIAESNVPAPLSSHAQIRLANGKTIYIDSVANGTMANINGVEIIKTGDGRVEYKGTAGETIYNTLFNPRGSKVVDMKLADGSHVWLNAGSSVTYPVAFTGNERKVSVTGEAYFEIAHDKNKPFIVSKGDVHVQVLGTHFNVNAYDDEPDIKVTLLEGSVRCGIGGVDSKILKPGQQANISGDIKVVNEVNLDEVMAWK